MTINRESDQCHPTKPKLFAGHGENKVRVIFRKKVKLALGSIKKTTAKKKTGTNSNHGLNDMVTTPVRFKSGIEEDADPVFLVLMKHVPDKRC